MLDSTSSILLLTSAGLILLRPTDVPLFARFAGRVAGFSVRSLRGLRTMTEEAFTQGEKALTEQGTDATAVRHDLRESFSQFDSLRSAVTRDVRSVGRFASVDMIRNRLTGQGQSLSDSDKPTLNKRSHSQSVAADLSGVAVNHKSLSSIPHVAGRPRVTTGADFIARSIEEAALVKQRNRILGGPQSQMQTPPHHRTDT